MRAMVRHFVVLAVLGAAFVASAAAAVSRPDDSRAATGSEQSEADARALDTLLERSGLKVQLESLSAGGESYHSRAFASLALSRLWYMSVMNGTLLIAVDAAAEATAAELAAVVPQLARDLR
jgi:hypothetical protein